jgi:iron complex outermembrane recepter protein
MKKSILLILSIFLSVSLFSQSLDDTVQIQNIVVFASYKAVKSTPFSFKNIDSKTLTLRGRDQEPACLLQTTPSVSFTTDNGLFTGYSYYRLRGIDQTRINVTLNGVPMNEPEDQGIYFNNYVDFLHSINDVQIIRGAGVSKTGVSSYGGSINFESIQHDKATQELSISGGSYNTLNATAAVSSKRGWARASFARTDGFKYHSGNKSGSFFYGLDLWPKKNITLYGFVGVQENKMAWIGSPMDSIKKDRRYNSNKDWETDQFLYVHNQLHHTKRINSSNSYDIVLYHSYLNGWYTMDLGHFDGNFNQSIYKLSLNSNWFGGSFNYNLKLLDVLNNNIGFGTYTYKRNHNNLINNSSYNENSGERKELSPYFKTTFNLGLTKIYGDVQYRMTDFTYNGPDMDLYRNWNFLNWSLGATYLIGDKTNFYFGIGENHREPTRTDLFGGNDEWTEDGFTEVTPESVLDYELGFKYFGENLSFNVNLYDMEFTNEIVLNGQVGPNSIVIHSNVAESFRKGIELDAKYRLNRLELMNVTNWSYNRVEQDGYSFTQVLTPSFITSSDVVYYLKNQNFGAAIRYNAKSFLDFANDIEVPDYYVMDVYSHLSIHNIELGLRVNNILNKLYYTSGVIGFDGNPGYFQQAGTNFFVTLKYKI